MIREVVMYGDPVLRAKCRPVTEVTDEIKVLIEDMLETMVEEQGVGLAAPQVGIPIQLAVIDVSHDPECVTYLRINGKEATFEECMPLIFLNPKLEFGEEKESDTEGCLSFPEIRAEIRRPEQVTATLETPEGEILVVETDGLLSRAIQHETDHLNGVLFIDRMKAATKVALKGKIRRIQKEFGKY